MQGGQLGTPQAGCGQAILAIPSGKPGVSGGLGNLLPKLPRASLGTEPSRYEPLQWPEEATSSARSQECSRGRPAIPW
jgi:hypothetical protein